MQHRELQAIIDTFQEPVFFMEPHRGRVIACNAAFVRDTGFSEEALKGKPFLGIPRFTRPIRRGLLDLFFKTKHKNDKKIPFVFQYATPQGSLKTFSATMDALSCGSEEYIMVYLRVVSATEADFAEQAKDIAAFNAFVDMTQEPWMEFRPRSSKPLLVLSDEDRLSYLLNLGREFVVHKASPAAQKLFGRKISGMGFSGVFLKGKDFMSLFYRENDALRFLDMLANVGELRAQTSLVTESGETIEVEMDCSVNFDATDTVTALYCIPYPVRQNRNRPVQESVSSQEQDFIFSQPFLGLGQLVPLQPLPRPNPADDVDAVLNNYLDEVLVLKSNGALCDLYGVKKNGLLMQRMVQLFPYRAAGVQVLKELFVTRASSFATYNEETGELLRVALFKAVFNNADHLVKIFTAVSSPAGGLSELHDDQKFASVTSFI